MKKILKKQLLLIVTTLIVIGCSSNIAKNPPINTIKQGLARDIQGNRAILAEKTAPPPAIVADALIPPLSVQRAKEDSNPGEQRFDLSVQDVPVQAFFTSLVEGTPYGVIVHPEVTGTITLNLKNVTIDQVLNAVQETYGIDHIKSAYGYQITPAGLQTRVFNLDYLNINRSGFSQTQASAGQQLSASSLGSSSASTATTGTTSSAPSGSGTSIDTRSSTDIWTEITTALTNLVGTEAGRAIVVSPQTGTIIVRAFPSELRTVAQYLDNMQVALNRQVILEAKILEVRLNDGAESGVDWTLLGNNGLIQRGNQADFMPDGAFSAEDFQSIFSVNFSGRGFSGAIRMLESQGNVQVLSSPRVSTLNNQKAVIKAGTDEFFVTDVSTTQSTSVTGGPTQDVTLTPFFSGISLDVTPQINENNMITLHIHPVVSIVKDQTKEIEFSSTNKQKLPLAISDIRESDSIVRAQSGQVIVIGGLIQNRADEEVVATPGLNKIPLVGSLFTRTQQIGTRSELVILLRPIVVEHGTWVEELEQSTERMQLLNRDYRNKTSPFDRDYKPGQS